MNIELTNFAIERHFDRKFSGTKILDKTPEQFINHVRNEACYIDRPRGECEAIEDISQCPLKVIDGYAPFCKLIVIENWTKAKTGTMKIELDNYQFLRSDYKARRKGELPVLTRGFDIPSQFVPKAKYLILVLYSYEQLLKEYEAEISKIEDGQPIPEFELADDTDWGIVAILGQMTRNEEPMNPATFLRNYMPIEFGGSGMEYPKTPEEKEKFKIDYQRSVSFWEQYAIVK